MAFLISSPPARGESPQGERGRVLLIHGQTNSQKFVIKLSQAAQGADPMGVEVMVFPEGETLSRIQIQAPASCRKLYSRFLLRQEKAYY